MVIVDFTIMPYSVGELFYLYQAIECFLFDSQMKEFEIAFIADISFPGRKTQKVSSYNYFEKVFALIQTVNYLHSLKSFSLFHSHDQFNNYINHNEESYQFWPSLELYKEKAPAYRQHVKCINNFYDYFKFLPKIKIRSSIEDRMRRFLIDLTGASLPVIVHLRVNKAHPDSRRNSNIIEWKKFFKIYLKENIKVKFFVITGTVELSEPEIQDLNTFSNVCLVKEYKTSLSDDYALCTLGAMFLGGPSGPSVVVMHSQIPYVLFNYKKDTEFHFVGTNVDENYNFAYLNQKLIWEKENLSIIDFEFKRLYSQINKEVYFRQLNSEAREINIPSIQVLS